MILGSGRGQESGPGDVEVTRGLVGVKDTVTGFEVTRKPTRGPLGSGVFIVLISIIFQVVIF